MSQIRTLVADCESLREKYEVTNKQLELTRRMLEEKTSSMQEELARITQQRDDLASEISQEREVVMTANKLADDLKKKLEMLVDFSVAPNFKYKTKLDMTNLQQVHTTELNRLNADINLRNDTIDKLSREAEQLQSKIKAKEQECDEYVKELQRLRNHGQKTQADLEKMRRLRDEMRKLAEGFD
uniref:Leucine zipper transcription factor-like protein 1 n=1 Tax=Angiostrongylus cantonensis TaxID=6313 RepID=A0A0K0D2P9_ANGCA